MTKTITCCYMGWNKEPVPVEIPADNVLHTLQGLVHGDVDVLAVRSDGIEFWVNDEGLLNGMAPNMAVYADKGMEKAGYLSQLDYESVVKDGDLYTVLHGPIVAARSDEDGNTVGVTPDDIAKLRKERPDSRDAVEEVIRIRHHLPPKGRDGKSLVEDGGKDEGVGVKDVAETSCDASERLAGGPAADAPSRDGQDR